MKTEYRHIEFRELIRDGKTRRFLCLNQGSNFILGEVKWYGAWRQYCYFTIPGEAVYSIGCLNDIVNFIEQLNTEQKSGDAGKSASGYKLKSLTIGENFKVEKKTNEKDN